MMWWFDSNKTKQNKKPSSKFFANLGLNIEGLCSFHCGIVRRNVRVFFFLICFLFFFFFRKDYEKRGKQETQRCPFSLAKALGGHLEILLALRGGGGRCAQSSAGLSFAWMFFVEIHLGAIS